MPPPLLTPPPPADAAPPVFDDAFRAQFRDLVLWRRDVRRFRRDPVEPALLTSLLDLARHAPSVGNCQPWRWVIVEAPERRAAVKASFGRANAEALAGYGGEHRELYARLKLEGLDKAPVHLGVFAEEACVEGRGLGRRTMPETLRYSVVAATQILWLAARAHGLGLGWVSIIEPDVVKKALDVPESWTLIGYFCMGWPEEEHIEPELVRAGWQEQKPLDEIVFRR
jgi:5,6-dimethylbenzimidazole synthase